MDLSKGGDKFTAEWRDVNDGSVILTPNATTIPGQDVEVCFAFTNPVIPQNGPEIVIESSGIVIHQAPMDSATSKLESKDCSGETVDVQGVP